MIFIFFLLYMYSRSRASSPDPHHQPGRSTRMTIVLPAPSTLNPSRPSAYRCCRCACTLDHFFDDKRACAAVLMLWTVSVCGLLQTLDLLHSDFMTWGPSAHTRFMTVSIDTWDKWWLLSVATFANACITEFMTDAIVPWLQNTIQDHKTQYLPYRKVTCFFISQAWCFHCNVMALFSVALIMTQIDFLMVRMTADLLVSSFTTFKFMRNKTVDPARYNAWFEEDRKTATSDDVEMLIQSLGLGIGADGEEEDGRRCGATREAGEHEGAGAQLLQPGRPA